MKLEPLLEVLANCAVFLETAPADVLDPDDAVTQLEEMAYSLSRLDIDLRQIIQDYFRKRAKQEKDATRRSALEELSTGLGLFEED